MELIVMYVAPIAVGTEVEVTWYEEVQRGLGGGPARTDERPNQPIVRDLSTGVVYQSDWAFGAGRRKRPDAPYAVGQAILSDFREQRVVRGTVAACRVITVRGYPELEVQTHLTLTTG